MLQITAVSDDGKSVHLQFLDSDEERERKVALCYLRRRLDDERTLREADFDRLRATWKEPIACDEEVARLEEVRSSYLPLACASVPRLIVFFRLL